MEVRDFFENSCEVQITEVESFGIYDELHNNSPAYLVFNFEKDYMLHVVNYNKKGIRFYPIDNCIKIFKENTKDKESSCDGMLVYENNLYFVELAKSCHKSVEDCISQLKSTIILFERFHSDLVFLKKYAIVSNMARPTSSISHEKCLDFREETGFGLSIKTVLNIK